LEALFFAINGHFWQKNGKKQENLSIFNKKSQKNGLSKFT
jgi:hypothetical protein